MKPREIPIGSDIERMSDSARANSPGACVSERCNYNGLTARNVEDCLDVIETMKHVHPSSVPLIHRIVALFLAPGPHKSCRGGSVRRCGAAPARPSCSAVAPGRPPWLRPSV